MCRSSEVYTNAFPNVSYMHVLSVCTSAMKFFDFEDANRVTPPMVSRRHSPGDMLLTVDVAGAGNVT